jgi:AraC-like DNA-binding protein
MHIWKESRALRLSYRDEVKETEHIFENHSHPSYELILVYEGDIDIVIGDRRYAISGGALALIPPLVYHSISVNGNVSYKRITALFDAELIAEEITGDILSRLSQSPIGISEDLAAPMERLRRAAIEGFPERDIPLVRALMTELLYTFTYSGVSDLSHSSHPLVRSICDYVDAHVTQKICLDGIADALFVSKSGICHVFKREMKISIKQYVLQKKLAYAASLIADGTPAGIAAVTVGYDNYANFYKLYKKLFHMSPMGK